jgi:hypothetical protein
MVTKIQMASKYGVIGHRGLPSYVQKPEPLPHQRDYERLLERLAQDQNQETLDESR